jgi:hypothetical protein
MLARETGGGVSSEPKNPKKSKAWATVQSLKTITAATNATIRRMPGRSRCFAKRLPVNSNAFSLTDQGLPALILDHTASDVKRLRSVCFPYDDRLNGYRG